MFEWGKRNQLTHAPTTPIDATPLIVDSIIIDIIIVLLPTLYTHALDIFIIDEEMKFYFIRT